MAKSEKLTHATQDPVWVRWTLVTAALLWLALIVAIPLVLVFVQAFEQGGRAYLESVFSSDTWSALSLTLLVVAVVVPLNTAFGVAAAWSIAKFDFPGKSILSAFIDIPFSVSPVISGLVFVLLFGSKGIFGEWLSAHDVKILFAVPGLVLATLFVTFPFVARELIPAMQAQGIEEEQAALVLGASGWQMFWRITLPNSRWALLYGIVLCTARAMGEFGAVSVVSGHIRGKTDTLPLHVEILYNEYNFAAAFAAATLLAGFGLVSLVAKKAVEYSLRRQAQQAENL